MKNLKICVSLLAIFTCNIGFSTVRICGNHTYADGHTARVCHYFYAKDTKCDSADMLAIVSQPGGFTGGWTCQSDNFGIATTNSGDASLIRTQDGRAFLIVNGETTQVASDAFAEFIGDVKRNTANTRVNTQVIQMEIDKFLDSDDGYVSDARLMKLSTKLGVPVAVTRGWNPKDEPGYHQPKWSGKAAEPNGPADSGARRADECSLPDCSCRVVSSSGDSLCEGGTEEETAAGQHYCACGKWGALAVQSGGAGGNFTAGDPAAITQLDLEGGDMNAVAKPKTPTPQEGNLQAQRQYSSTPVPSAPQETSQVNSRPAPRQQPAGVPGEEHPPSTATLRNLQRKGVLMDHLMQRMVFNPANTRRMTSMSITPMNRDLTENDSVYFVEPMSYAILNTENFNPWGISYFWEVVSTDQGILIAIPVPNIESYSRAPVACPCETEHDGTCSTTGFCFYSLPVDKCVLKPIIVEDPELCITLSRTAQGGPIDVNFIDTFSAQLGSQNVSIVVRGNIGLEPFERKIWASFYAPGVGCFLEANVDTTMENKQVSAAKIRNTLSANGLTGRFKFGITAETTKPGKEDQSTR